MTACGGNLIGGEIKRNEQCPLCGLATIELAELGPQRPLFRRPSHHNGKQYNSFPRKKAPRRQRRA